jgi:FixJ family two-component response regulator
MSEDHLGCGPLDQQPQQRRTPTLIAAISKETLTVCVVDDDRPVLKAVGRLLSSAGHEVASFTDPIVFLRYADTHHPKVVVLDIAMPVMNGLEVQSRLRVLSPSSRIIILTSKDDPSIRERALNAGAAAFFLKPFRDEEFLDAIESASSQN